MAALSALINYGESDDATTPRPSGLLPPEGARSPWGGPAASGALPPARWPPSTERWKDDPLVVDKWFTLQAAARYDKRANRGTRA